MTVRQSAELILVSVSVSGFSFDKAFDGLTAKYGPPRLTRSIIHNRMNAEFEQLIAVWVDGTTTLRLERHGLGIDDPFLLLSGEQFLKEAARDRAAATAKAASGL